ncbi:GNAT family N-acetyltransferase [Pseudalkalibacillus hwajinpoensis]|uniref:GNAT family N-acetyltransferase n=1 Tax=Guptibacillus hwajinpoensis TaxID=208199 RepID=UPI00325C2E10
MKVRKAKTGDEEGIASLLSEMGYPVSSSQLKDRIKGIMDDSNYTTLVLEEEGVLISMLGMHIERSYVSDIRVARIITMITSAPHRQKGAGTKLMTEAEKQAIDAGAFTVVLNSGNREERKAAHRFYEGYGFLGKSTGFYKSIG